MLKAPGGAFVDEMVEAFRNRVAEAQKDIARKAMLDSLVKNEHGHYTFDITGLDLSGADEVARLQGGNYKVSDYAKSCFTSTKKDGYDAKHRLVAEQKYRVVLVFGNEIKRDAERTTKGFQDFAAKFGYAKPLAGIVPRIREVISDDLMKEFDIWYVAALHDPIADSDGYPSVLLAYRGGGGRWVSAYWVGPGRRWDDSGAFAFLVPASQP